MDTTSKKIKTRKAITLVELMITVIAMMILIVGISGILAQGHKNYNMMYERTNSEVVRNAYEARRIFDRIVRKSTIKEPNGFFSTNDLYVYYYSNEVLKNLGTPMPAIPDKYARFNLIGKELWLETGDLVSGTWNPDTSNATTQKIAYNVSSVEFIVHGVSIRMVLRLDNESEPQNTNKLETLKMTVTTTAIRHNQ